MSSELVSNHAPFKPSPETRECIEILKGMAIGQVVPYKAFSKAVQGDVQRGARKYLMSAKRIVFRELGWEFYSVPNVGVKRLEDSERVKLSESRVRSINKASRRCALGLAGVNYENLSQEEMHRFNMNMSVARMVSHASGAKVRNVLDGVVMVAGSTLNIGKTLEVLGKVSSADV